VKSPLMSAQYHCVGSFSTFVFSPSIASGLSATTFSSRYFDAPDAAIAFFVSASALCNAYCRSPMFFASHSSRVFEASVAGLFAAPSFCCSSAFFASRSSALTSRTWTLPFSVSIFVENFGLPFSSMPSRLVASHLYSTSVALTFATWSSAARESDESSTFG